MMTNLDNIRMHWLTVNNILEAKVQLEEYDTTTKSWVAYHDKHPDYYYETQYNGYEADDMKPSDLVRVENYIISSFMHDDELVIAHKFGPNQSIQFNGHSIPVIMDDARMRAYFGSSDEKILNEIHNRLKTTKVQII